MRPNQYYIDKAIEQLKGKVTIGDVIAHKDDPIAYELIDIVGDIAIGQLPNGDTKTFPLAEVFNVNVLKTLAVELMLLDNLIPDRDN